MLKNYLKITWKVLTRKKLFTLASFLGISLTLTVIIIAVSFYDFMLKPNYPAYKQNDILLLNKVTLWGENPNRNVSSWIGSYRLLEKYVKPLKTARNVSIFTYYPKSMAIYNNENKIEINIKYTDAEFWEILDFDFLYGRHYNEQEVLNQAHLAVINKTICEKIFGNTQNVVGKWIEIDKKSYTVVGIVEDVSPVRFSSYGNVWVPLTTSKINLENNQLTGPFSAMILPKSKKSFGITQEELLRKLSKIEFPEPKYQWNISAPAHPFKIAIIKMYFFMLPEKINWFKFQLLIFSILCLFVILPLLNIININSNRLTERLSEIGIRKSFGASKRSIVYQFLFENVFMTLVSGVAGCFFAIITLKFIEHSKIIPDGNLNINLRALFISFIIMIIFGLISGGLPAYLAAKNQITNSLNTD